MFLLNFYDFNILFLYSFFSFILALIMCMLPFVIAQNSSDNEKISSYECGFEPFEDARVKFDIHFYIIAIMFIIFDIELLFLFPWVLNIFNITFLGYICFIIFVGLITLGFYYEWLKKALDWS
jgi:NADH-quinone oxidoreductase subunit A